MPEATSQVSVETEQVFEGYRRWGYLAANLDPLGFLTPIVHPELILDGDAAAAARKFYCGSIGAEFEHIDDPVRRRWICERLESTPPEPDRAYILDSMKNPPFLAKYWRMMMREAMARAHIKPK